MKKGTRPRVETHMLTSHDTEREELDLIPMLNPFVGLRRSLAPICRLYKQDRLPLRTRQP